MARDRLAAMRAQKQESARDPAESSPQAPRDGGGHYEMSRTQPSGSQQTGDLMSAFYSEIGSIQDGLGTLNNNISRISILHSRSLDNLDDATMQHNARELDDILQETVTLTNNLKGRIKQLQQRSVPGREGQIRQQQTGMVRQKFLEAIQNYQQVERQYREKYRQRVERQFKIVKPDATPEEVTAVVNDDQAGPIFTEALQASTQYRESRAAYREVQTRQADVRRIETTLGELSQLFGDMSLLVEQQDETVGVIQTTAVDVERHAEVGLDHTQKAVTSARAARRKRWICFIIVLIIIAIIGIVVGVTVAVTRKHH